MGSSSLRPGDSYVSSHNPGLGRQSPHFFCLTIMVCQNRHCFFPFYKQTSSIWPLSYLHLCPCCSLHKYQCECEIMKTSTDCTHLNNDFLRLLAYCPTMHDCPFMHDGTIFVSSTTMASSLSRFPIKLRSLMLAEPMMTFVSSTIINLLWT